MFRFLLILCLLFPLNLLGHTDDTTVGRFELVHPDPGHEGGTTLHTKVRNAWTSISDEMNSRYEEKTSIADSTLTTHTHNFGVAFEEIVVLLYTGTGTSKVLVDDPTTWTIAANGTNPKTQIDITTPSSGGPHDYSVVFLHAAINSDDLKDITDKAADCDAGQTWVKDSVTGKMVCGASGDSSFKPTEAATTVLKISSGTKRHNGKRFCTYSGSGNTSSSIIDLTVSTSSLSDDTYKIYIDSQGIAETQLTDYEIGCYFVEDAEIAFLTDAEIDVDLNRYVGPIGQVVISGGGGTISSVRDDRPEDSINWANLVVDTEPCGVIKWSSVPLTEAEGYLLADGSAVSRATYDCLNTKYAAESYAHGNGDGSTTFNLPDIEGRSLIAQDSVQTEFDVIGESDSNGILRTHTHTVNSDFDVGGSISGDGTHPHRFSYNSQIAASGSSYGIISLSGGTASTFDGFVTSTNSQHSHSVSSLTVTSGTIASTGDDATLNAGPYIVERAYIKHKSPTTSVLSPSTYYESTITSVNTSCPGSFHQFDLPASWTGKKYHCNFKWLNTSSKFQPQYGLSVDDDAGHQCLDLSGLTISGTNYLKAYCYNGTSPNSLPVDNDTIVTNSAGNLEVDFDNLMQKAPTGFSYLTTSTCPTGYTAVEQGFIKLGSSPSTTCINESGEGGACNGTSDIDLSHSHTGGEHGHTEVLTAAGQGGGSHDHNLNDCVVGTNGGSGGGLSPLIANQTNNCSLDTGTKSHTHDSSSVSGTIGTDTTNGDVSTTTDGNSAESIEPEHIVMRLCVKN